jgi:hypothetical protein
MDDIAPKNMPDEMVDDYTLNGKIRQEYCYVNDASAISQKKINEAFTDENFDDSMERVANREQHYYGQTDTWLYEALSKYPIEDKSICVIGSTYPWYEVVALDYGAPKVTVIEYAERESPDEMVEYIKPNEVGDRKFDCCFSISSFEHDGLGRYGDPLNPNGDIESMSRMKTLLNKDGLMYLAVPLGLDTVVWNAHRFYGRVRLPMLFDGWEVIDTFGVDERVVDQIMPHTHTAYQPIFVLRNT